MLEAAAPVGQIGRDPLDARIAAELGIEPDGDVAEMVVAVWRAGFGHRNFGAERIGRISE
jgi:hypothetical protein